MMLLSFIAARAVRPGMHVFHQGLTILVRETSRKNADGQLCCSLVGDDQAGGRHSLLFQEQSAVQLRTPMILRKGVYSAHIVASLAILETINLTGGVNVQRTLPVGLGADPEWLDLATAADDLRQALWEDEVFEACLVYQEHAPDDDM